MQVSHKDDHITHAVISKRKPIELKMAQSAEFFQVLFKSLYKYPTVAMVRETICNAWDAHIEAGKLDVPIEITLDHEYFSIRDFGQGIPDEDMDVRYCVMGGSTKAANETVTGGFGLGCKAPFAVTDHFEVTSMNQGNKTIYSLSRSSGEVEGIPGCTPIVTVPTSETGLEVKIPTLGRFVELEALIKRVVYGGGIRAKLNGEELVSIPLKMEAGSWVISRVPTLAFGHQNRSVEINIRYGNVVYPGNDLESYMHTEYREVYNFLESVGKFLGQGHTNRISLVIQAQPGTLSVTPSRETLSMVTKTVQHIEKLFAMVHAKLIQDTIPVAFEAVKDVVEVAVKSRDVRALTCVHHVPPHTNASSTHLHNGTYYHHRQEELVSTKDFGTHVSSVADLGKALIHNSTYYKRIPKLWRTDLIQRMNRMIEENLLDKGAVQSFRKVLTSTMMMTGHSEFHEWFKHRIAGRLVGAMIKHPHLDPSKLFVPRLDGYSDDGTMLVPITKWAASGSSALQYMKFLRKLVILCHTKELVAYNLQEFPESKEIGGYDQSSLVYIVGRNQKNIDAAKILFERHGYTIIDMTITREWMTFPPKYEKALNEPPKIRKYTKPKQGFVPLNSLLDRLHGDVILRAIRSTKGAIEERLAKPRSVLQLDRESFGEHLFRLKGFSAKASVAAAKLFGHEVGVVVNSVALEKAHTKKGYLPGERFILDTLMHELEHNPRIQAYLPLRFEDHLDFRILHHEDSEKFVRAVVKHRPAAKKFGIQNSMVQRDWEILKLWEYVNERHRSSIMDFYPELKACPVEALKKKLDAIPTDPKMTAFLKWVYADSSWHMLDVPRVAQALNSVPTTDKQKAQHKLASHLLLSVLKGV